MDVVATTSPSPPLPTLARCYQDHKFDIQNLPLLLHGKTSLYSIWMLNHHGEYHSLDPLKWDLQDFREKISLKDFKEEISLNIHKIRILV